MSETSAASVPHTTLSPAGEFAWHAESVQLLVLSASGNLLQWNQAARRGLGSHVELREGEPVWGLLPASSASLLRASLQQARSRPVRSLLTFSDGETFAFTLSCWLQWTGDACYLFGEELVEREKRMNEELLALTSELARVTRERTRLAAQLERTLTDLHTSHWQIRRIQDHLPICAVCHKVPSGPRDQAPWEPLIEFLAGNGMLMTHGYCPECEAAALAELDRVLPPPHPVQAAAGV
ncbi:MAG TPA: PAS domain-containing protein [Longimicrobium sp.]|nr:PAS domain-containing protein [Longimicrobium sp.]